MCCSALELQCCCAVVLLCCSAVVLQCCCAAVLLCCSAIVLMCCSANVLLLCLICLNVCFSVSESMSVTYLQTYRHTEPLLEVLADLKIMSWMVEKEVMHFV